MKTSKTKTVKMSEFDRHNDWLDVYNSFRNRRPVLTADELRAASQEGQDPKEVSQANDDLADEYDSYEE